MRSRGGHPTPGLALADAICVLEAPLAVLGGEATRWGRTVDFLTLPCISPPLPQFDVFLPWGYWQALPPCPSEPPPSSLLPYNQYPDLGPLAGPCLR